MIVKTGISFVLTILTIPKNRYPSTPYCNYIIAYFLYFSIKIELKYKIFKFFVDFVFKMVYHKQGFQKKADKN